MGARRWVYAILAFVILLGAMMPFPVYKLGPELEVEVLPAIQVEDQIGE